MFCDSDGNCIINLGFIPDRMVVDAEGNYIANDSIGHEHRGVVPYSGDNYALQG